MKTKVNLLGVLLLFWSCLIQANDTPKGWKWYNEPKPPLKQPKKKPKPLPPNTVTKVMSATEQMDWFHEAFNEAVNDATINPEDPEKLLKVERMKRYILKKSTRTGMTFKQLLLDYPELSYTKDRPTEQAARSTYHSLERNKKIAAVQKMQEEGWGFFFVYEGNDSLSKALAPSIQQFSDTYSIELLGLSNDGTFIESVRNNRSNDNKVVVPYTPALILVNPHTSEFKPLVYGFISQNDLLGRFYNVATDYQTPDF